VVPGPGHTPLVGVACCPFAGPTPRVTLSFEGNTLRPPGLREYLVVRGRASIEDGGAPELLQELAHVHLGPDVKFPPIDEPPPGVRMRIAVEHVGGIGSWAD